MESEKIEKGKKEKKRQKKIEFLYLQFSSGEKTYNAMLRGCLLNGDMNYVMNILSEMEDAEIPRSVATFNLLLEHFCKVYFLFFIILFLNFSPLFKFKFSIENSKNFK